MQKAIAARNGRLSFNVNAETCSSLHYADSGATRVEVEAITLAEALALEPEGRIDLIKMDIEGEEVPILLQADAALFSRVAQITVEFHDFLDASSLPSILLVIERLKSQGFTAFRMSWRSHGDMLFINENLDPLTPWQRLARRHSQISRGHEANLETTHLSKTMMPAAGGCVCQAEGRKPAGTVSVI